MWNKYRNPIAKKALASTRLFKETKYQKIRVEGKLYLFNVSPSYGDVSLFSCFPFIVHHTDFLNEGSDQNRSYTVHLLCTCWKRLLPTSRVICSHNAVRPNQKLSETEWTLHRVQEEDKPSPPGPVDANWLLCSWYTISISFQLYHSNLSAYTQKEATDE